MKNENDTEIECAWCGGGITEHDKKYPNKRGEVFCSVNHRTASNRALKRFLETDILYKRGKRER